MNNIIIIVGLERSGTSYITKCIEEAGIPMRLDNMGGSWEDKEIFTLNRTMNTHDFIPRLTEYKRKANQRKDYGFKDPLIIFNVEKYFEVFSEAKYICCIRNPISASKSMIEKIGIGLDYYTALLRYTAQLARVNKRFHLFNYDGNIKEEEQKLSGVIGKEINLSDSWKIDYINSGG